MATQHTIVFPVTWRNQTIDVHVTFYDGPDALYRMMISHTEALPDGRTRQKVSYAESRRDAAGRYLTGHVIENGSVRAFFDDVQPRDEAATVDAHFAVSLGESLNVSEADFRDYEDRVIVPTMGVLNALSSDRSQLGDIPDGTRLRAVNAWVDSQDASPDWRFHNVNLYRAQ